MKQEMFRKRITDNKPVGILLTKIALCLLLTLSGKTALAQENMLKSEYSNRRYTMHDGISNLSFNALFQDKKGFLWMATLRGFSRFDGSDFKNFLADSLANSYIIRQNHAGETYIYSHQSVFIVDASDNISIKEITDSLWLCTKNSIRLPDNYLIFNNNNADRSYLAKMDEGKIKELIYIPQLSHISAMVFTYIHNNKFYFPVHKDKCIYIYDLNTRQLTSMNFVARVFFNHSKLGLLAIDNNGIYSIQNNTFTQLLEIPDSEYFADAFIGNVQETENGSLWILAGSWIYRFMNNQLKPLLEVTNMIDFLYDREQNLWIAASDGIYNFFHLDFKNHSLSNGEKITAIAENGDDYWICAGNILYNSERNRLTKIKYPIQPGGYFFPEILAANDRIYFPYDIGVLIRNKSGIEYAETKIEYSYYFRKIIALKNNEILAMSIFDLNRLSANGEKIQVYSEEFTLQREIYDIAIDKSDHWYIAGNEGLSIAKNEKVQLIQSGMTSIVVANKDDKIFTACGGSLNVLDNDTLRTLHKFPSLIQAMRFLDNGFLMLTTLTGLYLIDIPVYFSSGKIQYFFYDYHNGFTGMIPNPNSLYMDSKGIVWVTTNSCVVSFDPETLIRKASTPILIVGGFAVSTDNVRWENHADFANTKFSYNNKNFRFQYIGLNYSAVENVRYHYRLVGFQNNWSEPVKQREVMFNNLPPGDYIFEIYADAGTDESRSETQSFVFTIKPAFWQTTWFIAACIVFLLFAGAGIALFFQQRRNRALWEKLRAEKELNELRISSIRLKAIPHFNANILAAIEYYITNRSREEVIRILDIYSDFTYQTLSEVDKAARPLSEELEYVRMYLDLEKIRFIEKFDFQINMDSNVNEHAYLPNMILHTYCENAVKHGLMPLESGGKLTIHISQHDQIVRVSVEDNGVGRAIAAQNSHIHSWKQGLSILNRQIEIYNHFNSKKINQYIDDLANETGQPAGTRFTVEVPLDFSYIN